MISDAEYAALALRVYSDANNNRGPIYGHSCRAPGLKTKVRIALAALIIIAAVSCARSPSERTWKEEVRLSDGRVIQVERHERYRESSELGGLSTLFTLSAELRARLSATEELPSLQTGGRGNWEVPLILDVDSASGSYFVITMENDEQAAEAAGLDIRKRYYEYRLADGAWTRQPVSDSKLGWGTNLLLARRLGWEKGFVPLAAKEAADSDSGIGMNYKCVHMSLLGGRCNWPRELTWNEEVRLSDGRVIKVQRREQYRLPLEVTSLAEVSGAGDLPRRVAEIGVLASSGEPLPVLKAGDESTSEVPLVFDLEPASGIYFAITIAEPDDTKAVSPGSEPSYFEYRLVDGAWTRSPLSGNRRSASANLLLGVSLVKRRQVVGLDQKELANRDPRIGDSYKTILPVRSP